MEVNNLTGSDEAEAVRRGAAEMPQTLMAFVGADGLSVKIVCRGELLGVRGKEQEVRDYSAADISLTSHLSPLTSEQIALFHENLYERARLIYNGQLGVTIEKEISGLQKALDDAFQYDEEVLVEEYIAGQETSVCMMRLKDGSVKVWPVVLIHPHAEWYDFNAKYSVGGVDHLVPAPLPEDITRTLKDISVKAFEVLGCAGVARTDCMVDKDGNCYVLEMNTVPGMTPTSLVPDAARAEGTDFGDLCEMILETAHL